MSTHYHAIIVGSGQGGGPLAQAFAKAGHRTAMIESTHVGGTCVNEGCTPTKTMVASAKVANSACRAVEYGVEFKRSSLVLNMATVRKRKRDIVDSFRTGGENRMKGVNNLDLYMGKAKFMSSTEIEVQLKEDNEIQRMTADKFFINAGCAPAPLTCKNADKVKYLNSTTIMELDTVPKHLVVIGGGYIGVEFAQMFRRFGSKVSIVQRGPRLLANEDVDVSEEVQSILSKANIDIYFNAEPTEISNVPTGQVVVSLKLKDGSTKSLMCNQVLAAAGRIPNTTSLDVSAAGIEVDAKGFTKVTPELQTTALNIWALGDIKGGPQFTHISYDDFRILSHNHLPPTTPPSQTHHTTTSRLVPYTVFMDPQLGRIGPPLKQLLSTHAATSLQVAKMPMAYVARALELDETKGFMKAVVHKDTNRILSFTCLGIEGGEVMSMVQIAMMGGLTWMQLRDGCFAHPCLSESLNNLWGMLEDVKVE